MVSTLISLPNKRAEQPRTLTIPRVLIFYSICILSGWFVSLVLRLTGLTVYYDPLVRSGLYGVLLIPVAYAFDPRIFSKPYWKVSPRACVGIAIIALAQFIFESGAPLPPIDNYRIFEGILVAPFVEELLRAVMIRPLMERLGGPVGLAVTALLWAWLHDFFWIALAQQTILCLISVYTRRSLPSAIGAHLVMNLIAVWHIGWHTVTPLIHSF
jgi:membrane protease YdiL (CAAX protease family)